MDRLNEETNIRKASIRDLIWLADQIRAERQRRDICEHGVPTGDWCEPCNREYKRAASSHD